MFVRGQWDIRLAVLFLVSRQSFGASTTCLVAFHEHVAPNGRELIASIR